MVTVTKQSNGFLFEVKGLHKLWAFKNQLTIPFNHVLKAYQDKKSLEGWAGWRLPGTSIPGIFTAGTFYKSGNKIFWDVSNQEKCIVVDLKDEEYKQLVIEVENPEETIQLLSE